MQWSDARCAFIVLSVLSAGHGDDRSNRTTIESGLSAAPNHNCTVLSHTFLRVLIPCLKQHTVIRPFNYMLHFCVVTLTPGSARSFRNRTVYARTQADSDTPGNSGKEDLDLDEVGIRMLSGFILLS